MKTPKRTVLWVWWPPWGPPRKKTPNPGPGAPIQVLRNTLSEREK